MRTRREIHGPHLAFTHPLNQYSLRQIRNAKRMCIALNRGRFWLCEHPDKAPRP